MRRALGAGADTFGRVAVVLIVLVTVVVLAPLADSLAMLALSRGVAVCPAALVPRWHVRRSALSSVFVGAVPDAFLCSSTMLSLSLVAAALLLSVPCSPCSSGVRSCVRAVNETPQAGACGTRSRQRTSLAHVRCRRVALCARSNVGRPSGEHAAAAVTRSLSGAARHDDGAVVLRVVFARVPKTHGKRGALSREQSPPRFPRSLCSPRLRIARTHRSPLRPTTCAQRRRRVRKESVHSGEGASQQLNVGPSLLPSRGQPVWVRRPPSCLRP